MENHKIVVFNNQTEVDEKFAQNHADIDPNNPLDEFNIAKIIKSKMNWDNNDICEYSNFIKKDEQRHCYFSQQQNNDEYKNPSYVIVRGNLLEMSDRCHTKEDYR